MSNHTTEVWLRMYEEQVRHVRHHETLRSHSTNIIAFLSAAILAFMSSESASEHQSNVLSVFLLIVNLYGFAMSSKHYERSCRHRAVSKEYRNIISKHNNVESDTINMARGRGKENHNKEFRWWRKISAHFLWNLLHFILAVVAIILLF